MSIFDKLFGGEKPDTTAQVQQPDPNAAPPEPEGIDKFGTLWAPVDPDKASKPFDVSTINDLSKLPEIMAQQNYLQGADPADLAAIAGGGEDAVKAIGKLMNTVAQQVATQSITAAGKLVENGLSKSLPAVDNRFQQMLRSSKVSDAISASNPMFSNPAAAPLIQLFQSQLETKFPKATPDELATMTREYFDSLAVPQQKQNANPNTNEANPTDWGKFFG